MSTLEIVMFCHRFRSFILLSLFLLLSQGPAGAQLLQQQWQHVDLGGALGDKGMECLDLDGDGDAEVALACGSQIYATLQYEDEQYSILHAIHLAPLLLEKAVVRPHDASPGGSVYLFFTNGTVQHRKLEDLSLMATHDLPYNYLEDAVLVDALAEPGLEMVVCDDNYVRIYSLEDFSVLRETSDFGGQSVAVGDVDDDGQAEVILEEGFILDADTLTEEWAFLEGFGDFVAVGDLDGDGVDEIVGMDSWDYITAFDGQAHTPLWQINADENLEGLCVQDTNGDGIAEILTGNRQWGDIVCWDTQTQAAMWQIHNPDSGTTGIALGDADGDDVLEVFWGAGHHSTGEDLLYVGDTELASIEWHSTDLDGPFSVAMGHLTDPTVPDLALAAYGSGSGYDEGVFMIFDAAEHQLQYQDMLGGWSNNITCMSVARAGLEGDALLILATSNNLSALLPDYYGTAWETSEYGRIERIETAELAGDGQDRLVVADQSGYVRVLDPQDGSQLWSSISTGGAPRGLAVLNVDDDLALEIAFISNGGVLYVYDGITYQLENQIPGLSDARSLAGGDWNLDGSVDFFIGRDGGEISILDARTLRSRRVLDLGSGTFTGLALVNLDQHAGLELVAGADRLVVVSSEDDSILFEAGGYGTDIGLRNSLRAADFDQDGYMDLYLGSHWGGFHLESSVRYPDTTPPRVLAVSPFSGQTYVGLDTPIRTKLDENLDPRSFAGSVTVRFGGGPVPLLSPEFDPESRSLILRPENLWPPSTRLDVRLSGAMVDTAGNGLDGNLNGISEGSPTDDHTWSFFTGTSVDTVGPSIVEVVASADSVWEGQYWNMTFVLSDSSTVAISTVDGAEYFLNTPGEPGTGISLPAADGRFDGVEETLELELNTDGWPGGLNQVFVRGIDSRGNWGPFHIQDIIVLGEDATYWPQYGFDAAHSGYNPGGVVIEDMPLAWNSPMLTAGGLLKGPCVAAGSVFVTGINGNIHLWALDDEDGTILWSADLGDAHYFGPPSFGYGMVYVQTCNHSGDSWLWAFDALTGQQVWRSPWACQWDTYLAPTIAEGKVFVGGGTYGGMYAFDAFSGDQLWWVNQGQYQDWTPAVHDGLAYSNIDGTVSAINTRNGNLSWSITGLEFDWHGYSLDCAPVVDTANNILIAPSYSHCHAIDLETRQVLWMVEGSVRRTPAVHDNRVYIPVDTSLRVYDVFSGQLLNSISFNCKDQPVVLEDQLVLSDNALTTVLDPLTLEPQMTYAGGGDFCVAGSRLVILPYTNEGVVSCYWDSDYVPTMLQQFRISGDGDAVNLNWWTSEPAEFRLTGRHGQETWEVPIVERQGLQVMARDTQTRFSQVIYTLSMLSNGQWVELESRTWEKSLPTQLSLDACGPNPFNARLAVSFSLPQTAQASIKVYDVRGHCVRNLRNEVLVAGRHEAIWDGRSDRGENLASGLYFVVLKQGEVRQTRKVILAK